MDGWTYDEAGNLLDDGTRSFTYDALNRLMEAGTFYRYNGDGVLVANGSEVYLHDLTLGLPQVVMREIGGSRERYLYGQARLAQVNMLGVRMWAHADALGTPRLTRTTDGVIVDAPRTDAWGRPLHGTEPQPFGFTGELQDPTSDLVYLRARWYNPTSGTFLSRDPFAGYPNQPYSLHPYQYAYSQPTTLTDRSGQFAENWSSVQFYSQTLRSSAEWHVQHATQDLRGVTADVLATMMAATVAIENNWGEVLGRRYAGHIKNFISGNPSTGIANFKVTTAMRIINDCNTPLELDSFLRSDVPYNPNSRLDRQKVYDKLQEGLFSIDLLAAHLLEGIYSGTAKGLHPSIFNISNHHWYEQPMSSRELHSDPNPNHHAAHGVRVVRNFNRAAQELGLTLTLASLPNGLEAYYSGIHPIDADMNGSKPFTLTEQDWAHTYAEMVD